MRIVAVIALLVFALTACVPWDDGKTCPYSDQGDRSMYFRGNRQGKKLKDGEEALHRSNVGGGDSKDYSYQVGDNDIIDHFLGYSSGYSRTVYSAKFGHRGGGTTGDYPEVEAHVRGYVAGIEDAADYTSGFSKDEAAVFAEGFEDAYVDGKDLCY